MRLDPRHPTWAGSPRFVPRVFVRPLVRFTRIEAGSGIVLLAAAVIAVIWANSPWSGTYHQLFEETRLVLELGPFRLDESLRHFVNDGLMCVFFFVVGLEIKRELTVGELRDRRAAILPVSAALGGMLFPALVFVAITSGSGAEAAGGWAIPMATDIAFAVGVVALLGRRIPVGAKIFILALAIADDLGAIVVIALFFSTELDIGWLAAAIGGLALVWLSQRSGVRSLAFYVPAAAIIWYAMLESGVHATLAGVALGFLTPVHSLYDSGELERKAKGILDTHPLGESDEDEEKSDHEAALLAEIATESIPPLRRLEDRLAPWSSFLIVPLFALANAGVALGGTEPVGAVGTRVALGVGVGLLVGKTVGVGLFTWITVRLGLGRLPRGVTWRHVIGLAALAGIGFTVSLFVTNLAFDGGGLADMARIGIFAGSLVAGVVGSFLLFMASRPSKEEVADEGGVRPERVRAGAVG